MPHDILVIEESPEVRKEIIGHLAQIAGKPKFIEARDGNEGLNKVSNQKFDLVITDIQMPKMDIRVFLAECKNLPKKLRPRQILLLSKLITQDKSFSSVGNITYISRPYDLDIFKQCMEVLLQQGEVETPTDTKSSKFDVEFIDPFIVATLKVLEVTAGVKAERIGLSTKKTEELSGDISAVMALNSSKKTASIAICFQEACYLKIVGSMLGEQYTAITEDNKDAVGEICNQIFGMAKAQLNRKGHDIVPAIPIIVTGKNHTVSHFVSGSIVAVKFRTEFGDFTIEATFEDA